MHLPEDEPPPGPAHDRRRDRAGDGVHVGTAIGSVRAAVGTTGSSGSVRPDCVTIGVAFAPQIVDELPVEPHDVRLDHVVTEDSVTLTFFM